MEIFAWSISEHHISVPFIRFVAIPYRVQNEFDFHGSSYIQASIPAKGSFDNGLCPTLGLTYFIQKEEKQQSKFFLNWILDRLS